jgi:hypothetical protein
MQGSVDAGGIDRVAWIDIRSEQFKNTPLPKFKYLRILLATSSLALVDAFLS